MQTTPIHIESTDIGESPSLSATPAANPAHGPHGVSSRTVLPHRKPAKSQYTEVEAAEELRISVDALRKLVRSHVVDRDEDVGNLPATTFQPSDLLVLRLLSGLAPAREE